MKEQQTVSVPADLWAQAVGALKNLTLPTEGGQVQAFLNRCDAVQVMQDNTDKKPRKGKK